MASPEIEDLRLIEKIAKTKKPVIISTGIADEKNIKTAINICKKYKNYNIILLNCISSYPAKDFELNLKHINILKKYTPLVGYSDHSNSDLASIISVSNGAKIIEKHFTLNKLQKGADHKISLEPKEFKNMVNKIRVTEEMLGEKVFRINDEVKKKRNMYLRYLTAKKDIKKGDILSLNNIGFFRHNKSKPGLEPKYFFSLKNKTSRINIKKNQIINKKILH